APFAICGLSPESSAGLRDFALAGGDFFAALPPRFACLPVEPVFFAAGFLRPALPAAVFLRAPFLPAGFFAGFAFLLAAGFFLAAIPSSLQRSIVRAQFTAPATARRPGIRLPAARVQSAACPSPSSAC